MVFYAGIDGGGSNTRALVASSDGRLAALGRAGPSNAAILGLTPAVEAIHAAIADAWRQLKLDPQPLASVFLGLAGVNAVGRETLRAALAQGATWGDACIVAIDHDIRIALAGGLGGQPGIAVIAGTGSAGYGRAADGRTAKAGGWGALIDDAGGGYWLARRALSLVARASDGRCPPTKLTAAALDFFGIQKTTEILGKLYPTPPPRDQLARLAPRVFAAAKAGDELAQQLVAEGAEELARIAAATAQNLFGQAPAPVVLTGGLAMNRAYRDAFSEALTRLAPSLRLADTQYAPVVGALLLASAAAAQVPTSALLRAAAELAEVEVPAP